MRNVNWMKYTTIYYADLLNKTKGNCTEFTISQHPWILKKLYLYYKMQVLAKVASTTPSLSLEVTILLAK